MEGRTRRTQKPLLEQISFHTLKSIHSIAFCQYNMTDKLDQYRSVYYHANYIVSKSNPYGANHNFYNFQSYVVNGVCCVT